MAWNERKKWLKKVWTDHVQYDDRKFLDKVKVTIAILFNRQKEYNYEWNLEGLAWEHLPDSYCDYGTAQNWLTLTVSPIGFYYDIFEDSSM